MEAQAPYDLFPVVCCGVDWLTVTSNSRAFGNPLERFGEAEIAKRLTSAGQLAYVRRFGYEGRSINGLFVGRRADGVCVQLSGPLCTPLAAEAITLSTNVSRIDLQVTVFCEGEQPHLGAWTRKQLLNGPHGPSRPGRIDFILGHPDGETLTLNRRVSDTFFRLYDKTAEAKLGAPRLVWRYEVELKGRKARWAAAQLTKGGCSPLRVTRLVHDAWSSKGVLPAFQTHVNQNAFEPYITSPSRDVLSWYKDSVSKSIATSFRRYGRAATLEALGLSNVV